MDGEAGTQAAADKAMMTPGSRPYLRLAEAGYLVSAALALANVVLLALLRESGFAFGWTEVLASAAITIVLSVAWFQLGRRLGVSWFTAAGAFGGLSVVFSLVVNLEPSTQPVAFSIISWAEEIVSLGYFGTQLSAFYTAAKAFQVRAFRYAAYLLVFGIFAPAVGAVLVAPALAQSAAPGTYSYLAAYGTGLLFETATALAAAAGFHRLRASA